MMQVQKQFISCMNHKFRDSFPNFLGEIITIEVLVHFTTHN